MLLLVVGTVRSEETTRQSRHPYQLLTELSAERGGGTTTTIRTSGPAAMNFYKAAMLCCSVRGAALTQPSLFLSPSFPLSRETGAARYETHAGYVRVQEGAMRDAY